MKKSLARTIVGGVDAEVLRFTADEDRALDAALVEADCIGTAAHVTALSDEALRPRVLAERDRARIVRALIAVMRRARRGAFRIGLNDQDVHLAVERALTRALGDLGRRVHTGRSRNDQAAVDLRLHGRDRLLEAVEAAAGLAFAALALGRRHALLPMVGRTHMQPAMPSSVGLWAAAHAESLLDDVVLLRAAYDLTNVCPLGSAAGYGVPLNLNRARTARLLGFARPYANALYAAQARGKVEAATLGAMAQVMLTLSRLAEDLVLYAAPEFGYFALPPGFCTGSSIMPQKRNPDVLEIVRARAARVQACESAAAAIVTGLPSGYSRDLQETKAPFLGGTRMTVDCLRVLLPLMRGLKPVPGALRAAFRPEVFAADAALDMVAAGTPFRAAYGRVKANLGALPGADPDKAVARRMRAGTARVDFDGLEKRAGEARRFARAESARCRRAIAGLLGVPYPDLG
ncbi:MAG: argininosuccinate lyase [Lentisphaerae bacterium]|nr:argininosuccinate lyase [Lentisphaerota bacterium]